MAEANKKLQLDTQRSSSSDYDIKELSGNESQYIEMDLLLGIADLHTPEAVMAAESAMAGSEQAFSIFKSDSSPDTEDDDTDDKPNSDRDGTDSIAQPNKSSKIMELH